MARVGTICLLMALGLAAQAARADIVTEVTGVDPEIRRNILVFLSLERYRNRDDLAAGTIERLIERADREVKAALRPFGYYEPQVQTELRERNDRDARVLIRVEPGPPVIMERVEVRVTGPGANDPVFTGITGSLPLREGERLSHADYERIKSDLQRAAATNGFLDARLVRSDLLVDPPQHRATAVLELETGERYRFGPVIIEQDAIRDSLARKYLRFAEGEPFNATEVLRTQFALDDSQYFSTVEVVPVERDRDALEVPVTIRAEPNRRDRYQFGIGYGTDTRVRGTASWENRRVNPRGHRFRTEVRAAQVEQRLEARYIIPILDPALEKFEIALESSRQEDLGDIETRNLDLEPSITTVHGRWQRVLFTTLTRTRTIDPLQGDRIDTLLIPGISFAVLPRGYLGEPIFTRALYAELRGSTTVLGSDSSFLQLRLQAERVFDFGERWHVFLRGELGASLVPEAQSLPGSQRFFAGGDRSVRGFGYNDLSPAVVSRSSPPVVARVGGRHLATGTVELIRDLPRNFSIATFVDFGNAFDRFGDPLALSAGVGVRYRLPVLTIGVDIAQALDEPSIPGVEDPDRSPRLHINFSPKL